MFEKLKLFIEKYDFFIITTHDPADADGIGAQLVVASILNKEKKQYRIINSSPKPEHFIFMDRYNIIEQWDREKHGDLPEQGGAIIVDTADLHFTGQIRDAICRSQEIFVIDHHETKPNSTFSGIYDPSAASTCEITVELAKEAGILLDSDTALAAYTGIIYDTGFFAYPKTGPGTFRAALTLLELGVNPNEAYRQLCENAATRVLFLQKKALASLTLHFEDRVAVQVLRKEDFIEAGALPEDTYGFVNFPLKAKEIIVSLLIKETPGKKILCSLRSKGSANVAKIAQDLGGGGHINAAGFNSTMDIDQTLSIALTMISKYMEKP
ncbi:MAG: bifunctional oligoribonuclease/PAP phosphatase NrnA [Treponema sp.]|nr:bifunctional oligoribonuclease/PAP phosphatase NrnA [Treponema sp.]